MMLSLTLKKVNGKLVHNSSADKEIYKEFERGLEEGQLANVFMDANKDDGTLAQIAKAKVCIRDIAKVTGYTFQEAQDLVKKKAGLCVVLNIEGEKFIHCKSFADCSLEDMSLAIQAIIDIGDTIGANYR